MKEIKIKEKWLYEAMDREMERKDGLKIALDVLAESLRENHRAISDLWCEIEKIYQISPKMRYYYIKKTHIIQETCEKDAKPSWVEEALDKKY